jgi:hypothetical protein
MKSIGVIAMVLGVVAGVAAQDAATLLPKNYRVQFENEWVRVTSVRYGANERLPEHTHTELPSAYVYVTDSGPVAFRHVGGPAVTRQPVKVGMFRVFRGIKETHEVENMGAATEFLRVELKTEGRDPATIRGKFERPPVSTEPAMQFDHAQFSVSRVWVQPGQKLALKADAHPALLIAMAADAGAGAKLGREQWLAAGSTTQLANSGSAPIDFLRIDFKTLPARPRS